MNKQEKYTAADHTFAVCAYKESPYLEECIRSLLAQRVKSNIIVTTSTDNAFIRGMAEKYQLPYFVNKGPGGIANDWNFAYGSSDTKLVTLAHQDDRYEPEYVADMLEHINSSKDPLIYFTGYNELRNGEVVPNGTMVRIKRIMLTPLKPRVFQGMRFFKRLSLSFGNPVACWSVCYIKDKLPSPVFVSEFRSNLDWEEWEKLSREKGAFVYSAKRLTLHRVHEGSETSNTINNGNIRGKEDYQMFLHFWPKWMAKFLMKFYIKAEKYNES
ncbi:MAG: glycosyltransferase family 2 protein [Lachnospiraceae bacterium]|nr:glycosyltransferase family 2 protein [Lachnospiraceae bacterium]